MTVGALIALVYDAVEDLPVDRDLAASWAAYVVTVARSGLWGVA